MQEFIDKEIAKKEAKERTRLERAIVDVEHGKSISTKKSWEQEIKEDTKIPDTAEELLRYYFGREQVIMEKLFGADWRRHVKQPDWPRERYTKVIEQKQKKKKMGSGGSTTSSDSDDEKKELDRKNMRERVDAATKKAKGFITFLNMKSK